MNYAKALASIKLKRIPDILEEYETEFDSKEHEQHIKIEGKRLEVANREQAAWYAYYDERRVEIHSVLKHLGKEKLRIRGKLFKMFNEGYQIDLGERAKERYIDHEEAYLEVQAIYLEVEELYEKYSGIVKAFEQRGYQLRNITELRIASIESVEI